MRKRFVIGMVIYAVVFLAIAGAGLAIFWNFIDAYEQSRPMNAVKAYVASVTDEDFCEGSEELLSRLDSKIQSREEACDVICNSVTEPLTYAKKSSESTEERQVYVLRSGKQVIGQFAITAGEEDKFGFREWTVTETSFDFAHLMGESVSVTVPDSYRVCVNGSQLDESYITASGIEYSALEEFYDDYDLPEMVTYTADNFLGSLNMEVLDTFGNTATITADMDMNSLLPLCDQEIGDQIQHLTRSFLHAYVAFTSGTGGSISYNYVQVIKYLIPNGELAQRLATAIDGLQYAQSWGDTLQNITINRLVDIGESRYMCDVTYIVETYAKAGLMRTENNLKLIFAETENGLRIEAMTRY